MTRYPRSRRSSLLCVRRARRCYCHFVHCHVGSLGRPFDQCRRAPILFQWQRLFLLSAVSSVPGDNQRNTREVCGQFSKVCSSPHIEKGGMAPFTTRKVSCNARGNHRPNDCFQKDSAPTGRAEWARYAIYTKRGTCRTDWQGTMRCCGPSGASAAGQRYCPCIGAAPTGNPWTA